MLLVQSLVLGCRNEIFDYEPNLEQAAMKVAVTKRGFNFFVYKQIDRILYEAMNFHIDLDIVFKVSTFQFRFHDLHLPELSLNDMQEDFSEQSPKLSIFVEGILGKLSFQFDIKQTTYPYFEDVGTGYFDIAADITFRVDAFMSPNCPYNHNFKFIYDNIDVHMLHFVI